MAYLKKIELIEICQICCCIAKANFRKLNQLLKKLSNSGIQNEAFYEAIIQSYLFCGFPSVIEALKLYKRYFPKPIQAQKPLSQSGLIQAGKINCKLIYGKNYKKLIENMEQLSPDIRTWMITEGYGKVLSRTGLTLREREFVNIAILTARYFENQLHSHLRGCINSGGSRNEIQFMLNEISNVAGKVNVERAKKLLDSINF